MSARQVSARQATEKQASAKQASGRQTSEKKAQDLATFISKVNKKEKQNGLKIRFAFVKRKRR